jgi:hypothetical protein
MGVSDVGNLGTVQGFILFNIYSFFKALSLQLFFNPRSKSRHTYQLHWDSTSD